MKRLRFKRPGQRASAAGVAGVVAGVPVVGALTGLGGDPVAAEEQVEATERVKRSAEGFHSSNADLAALDGLDDLGSAVGDAGNLLAAGIEGVGGIARALGNAAGSGLSHVSGVVDAAGAVGGGIVDVASAVGGALPDIAGAVVDVAGAAVEVAGAVGEVAGAVAEGAGEILGALGDIDLNF